MLTTSHFSSSLNCPIQKAHLTLTLDISARNHKLNSYLILISYKIQVLYTLYVVLFHVCETKHATCYCILVVPECIYLYANNKYLVIHMNMEHIL